MTNDNRLALLKSWQEVSKSFTEAASAYMDLTHCPCEAPHIKTAYGVFEEHAKLVAVWTGVPFKELLCWAYDLHYGEVASYDVKLDGKWHSARTIEEFSNLWDAINNRGEL